MDQITNTQKTGHSPPQRLYSRLITHFLSHHQKVPLDADVFYRWYAEQPLPGAALSASE